MLIDDEMIGGGPDCPSEGPGGLGAILMPSAPLKSRKGAFLMLAAPSQARTCPCVLAAPCMDGCVHGWAFLIPLLSAPLFLSFSMKENIASSVHAGIERAFASSKYFKQLAQPDYR